MALSSFGPQLELHMAYQGERTSPFLDDLLPPEPPALLQELPADDVMRDFHDDDTAETSTNPTMLVPAMVNAMFPLVSNTLSQENEDTSNEIFPQSGRLPPNNNPVSSQGLLSRDERAAALNTHINVCCDRLGKAVRLRLQEINGILKDDKLKATL
ncbi:uncharacterized protein LOC124440035 [Xenia sp. Carnegie-2017]|uniref:uncharacterized protein LOC124440035 n=1 Tax=Xenia sp. Carnegie-2017 TaxID=2897299 RepID=UPI001F03C778|nr:uncharacterized protein LOC124440035 [Xenia sp. Carnegie-2017]XP_046846317.1 uncharacterized protein LOC124440035 [Xenia sp. Carnegie-2017]XP_046846318.1 uncharacterized protein LOC124440035 [Xenia sp. Carnegie-2017]